MPERSPRRSQRSGDRDEAPRRHAESSRPSDRWERRGDRSGTPRNKLEERYRPERSARATRESAEPRFAPRSENPLASRRNEEALRSITNRRPALPPSEGPLMRPRRGWKKNQ